MRSNVVRDRQGFIWFGTLNGLARYDGYACKVYPKFSYMNAALFLHVDTKGRLWVGTSGSGLSLYDPTSDRFVNILPLQNESRSLQSPNINTICEDDSGVIWLVGDRARQPGLVWLDLGTAGNETNADSVARHAQFHNMYHEGFKDGVWVVDRWDSTCALVTTVHGLFICNRKTNAISRLVFPPVSGLRLDTVFVSSLFWETPRRLWIGTLYHGLYLFDRASRSLTAYHKRPAMGNRVRDDHIQSLQGDRSGRLWIDCNTHDLFAFELFDPSSGVYRDYLFSSVGPGKSDYTRMSVDSTGILWIPTADDGLYFLPPASSRFPRYALKGSSGRPMEMETIDRWSDGSYWVGAEGKVARVRLENLSALGTVDLFKSEKGGYARAGIWTSYEDGNGTLWYGTRGLGLYRFEPKTGQVKNFRSSAQLGGLLKMYDNVASIIGVGRDSLWIAAGSDGILSFDTHSNLYSEVPHTRGGSTVHMMKDREGTIWISDEARGLFVFDPSTTGWEQYGYNPSDPLSIRNSNHQNTYQDSQGRIWVGCDTLDLWEPGTRSFKHFPNPVFGDVTFAKPLGSDKRGRLWVQYHDKGLAILDPTGGQFANFDYSDGVVRPIAMSSLPDGRVILVGYGGMNIVDPDSLFKSRPPPPLVITKVLINDTANLPLQSISAGTGLRLPYDENVLEFGFAAIDPGATHLIGYLYRLEGLEKAWVQSNGRRFVRYPGLNPGNYVFRVKAVNKLGRWPDQEIALAVSIAPPWWRTTWAYGAYVFLFIGLLYAGYRVRLRQVHLQQEVEMEHFQAEHLSEVDRLKSRFFANISHEFRTPLTLILGPIQKWKERSHPERSESRRFVSGGVESKDDHGSGHASTSSRLKSDETALSMTHAPELHNDMSMAERNAHRLLRLINQLLDLSKLEAGAMKLRANRMNIVPLVKGIAYSFETSAGMRKVELNVLVHPVEIEVYCDKDMVEKILSNLLSNAFKFTPEGGRVSVSLGLCGTQPPHSPFSLKEKGGGGMSSGFVSISVSDTGIGIPPDQLDKVFDRFYQVDASQTREHEGSGIGLALVKELVELHHGTIEVQSEVGRGTTFTVRMPLGRGHLKDDEVVEAPTPHVILTPAKASDQVREEESEANNQMHLPPFGRDQHDNESAAQKPIVLIVEDNADVRSYIKDYLVPVYQVAEAGDGADGIEKAVEIIPDLIISDVMMPKKDGYEVCKTLKFDEKTSHIPIILLTAKAASENKIEGLEIGADDYLIKPFEPKELLSRIRNLIELRQKLRVKFSKGVELKPGEVAITSLDDAFLKRVMTAVEANMRKEDFEVEDLAQAVFLSRVQLYRKLRALTNLTPADFIRRMRLQRAKELLEKNAGTVAEIADSVGFSNHSHFAHLFKEQFGILPGDVRRN
jgi:signal transduction histidine kinase/DNA-binding response OmpR family regulator/ligand-binding sensor domain-containing protein